MTKPQIHAPLAALLLLAASLLFAAPASAKRYALLVGVSDYEQLKPVKGSPQAQRGERGLQPLKGPGNDVALMWHVLRENLGFKADDAVITILADRLPAGAPPKTGEPTKANILKALRDIRAKAVDKDDVVVVYFSGHGVQVPEITDSPDKPGQEQDGMSETFLPSDARFDDEGRPTNFILDKELNAIFYGSPTEAGFRANVWAIFDSCHSGDLTRSNNPAGIVLRSIDLAALGVPDAKRTPAVKPAATRSLQQPVKTSLLDASRDGNIVVFAAAGPTGSAIETAIKERGDGNEGPWHGGFTHLLARTITQHQPESYAALFDRLQVAYGGFNVTLPKPHVEGNLHLKLAGTERVWTAKRADGGLRVDAGSILGLKTGDLVSLHRQARLDGFARVKEATPLTALVEPLRDRTPRQPATLDDNASWTVRLEVSVGFTITVAKPPSTGRETEDWITQGRAAIRTFEARKTLNIHWLEPGAPARADVHLAFPTVGRGVLQFLPSTSSRTERTPPAVRIEGTADQIADAIEVHMLAQLAQRNLLDVADRAPKTAFADKVTMNVWVYTDNRRAEDKACPNAIPDWSKAETQRAAKLLDPRDGGLLLHCDVVFLVIDNTGDRPVDITCAYLDADGGIAAGMADGMRERPASGTSSCPDGTKLMGRTIGKAFPLAIVTRCHVDFAPCKEKYKSDLRQLPKDMPVGIERLMIILVEAIEGQTINFDTEISRQAADRTPPNMRGSPQATSRPELDVLRNLLGEAVRPTTRGSEMPRDAAVHFKTFTWTVAPPP